MPDPYRLLLRLSLALATVGGFGLGLALIATTVYRTGAPLPWLALAQSHGQVQAVGFVALFVFGVGLQLFPAFLRAPLRGAGWAGLGGTLLAVGLTSRLVTPWIALSPTRSGLLWLSGGLELAGALVALVALGRLLGGSVNRAARWLVFPATGFMGLLAALALNLLAVRGLTDAELVPRTLDEALLHLELWGFAVPICLGVSLKILPRFLQLRPTVEPAVLPALAVYTIGTVAVVAGWLARPAEDFSAVTGAIRAAGALAQFGALLALTFALRLFEPPVRPSGVPHVTRPTRRWFRSAYVGLLVGAGLTALFTTAAALDGADPGVAGLSAARHALAQGFLVPLIAGMAARILPGYSAEMAHHPRRLDWLVSTLLAAGALRVVGELGRGLFWWGPWLAAMGGALGTVMFLVFAGTLWWRLTPLPRRTGAGSVCPRRRGGPAV